MEQLECSAESVVLETNTVGLKEQKEKGKYVILAVTIALHDCSQFIALLADTFLHTMSSQCS